MKIKKTSNTRALAGKVVNVNNESTTDTYSCDYLNKLNNYSTAEQRIGTWIDGKPLYRKVYKFTSGSYYGSFNLNTDLTNTDTIYIKDAFAKNNVSAILTLPYAFTTLESTIGIFVSDDGSYIGIRTGTNYDGTNRYLTEITVILEYTKTTD